MAATGAPTSTPSSSSFNTPLSQLHSGDRTVHMEELDLAGVVIILPILSPHWERLISGELKEWDITEKMLFRTSTFGNAAANTPGVKEKSRDTVTLGLHTWHIEKFPAWDRFNLSHPEEPSSSFGIYARDDADSFLLSLQRDLMPVKLEIVGSSALCVTSAGERLFGQRLGYTEGEYKGQVVVQEADETTKIMEAEGWDKKKAIGSTCRGNEKVVGKCRMLVKMNRRQEIEN